MEGRLLRDALYALGEGHMRRERLVLLLEPRELLHVIAYLGDRLRLVPLLIALMHAARQSVQQRPELTKVEVPYHLVERVVVVELLLDQLPALRAHALGRRFRRLPTHNLRLEVDITIRDPEQLVDKTLVR